MAGVAVMGAAGAIDPFFPSKKQKTRFGGFFVRSQNRIPLLQLGFLVHDVLAYLGIELLHFNLFRHGAFVFRRGVEMTGTGTGF